MNTIYIFPICNLLEDENFPNKQVGQQYIAVTEEGLQLVGSFCSNMDEAKILFDQNGANKPIYEQFCPAGYNLSFVEAGGNLPETVSKAIIPLKIITNYTKEVITFI
jgi:hypothetical protein